MTQEQGFLQAIVADPEDEGVRLIYADWLEEQGNPRGEFIRLQCELEKLSADDPRRPDLEAREKQLLAEHANEWLGPLRGELVDWRFHRGFVDFVDMDASTCFGEGA